MGNHLPVGEDDDVDAATATPGGGGGGKRKALSAAGNCRINPSAMQKIVTTSSVSSICSASVVDRANHEYALIVAKNLEQATVERSILTLSSSWEEKEKENNTYKIKELKKEKKK